MRSGGEKGQLQQELQQRDSSPDASSPISSTTSASSPDITRPLLHGPGFRFGQPVPSLASKSAADLRDRPPRSRPSSFSRSSASKIQHSSVHLDLNHSAPHHELQLHHQQQQQQHRRRILNAALATILVTTALLLILDGVTGVVSKALQSALSPLHAFPAPRSPPPSAPQPFAPVQSPTAVDAGNSDSDADADRDHVHINDGIPPKDLPLTHPDAALLSALRAHTQMTPRWPRTRHADINTLRTYGPAYASIIVSHTLRVVYVPVFKVATTSTMWDIAYLENNRILLDARARDDGSHMKLLHEMGSAAWVNHTVYDMSNERLAEILDNPEYLKFGFVRNPYDRVISSYVDKIVRPDFSSYEYQSQLYSLYGDSLPPNSTLNTSRKPTFSEFLHAVRDVLKQDRLPQGSTAYENNLSRRDLHWRPQNELLHSDLIHLDFVGHYHEMDEDTMRILKWMYRHTDRRMPEDDAAHLHSSNPELKSELFGILRSDDSLRDIIREVYADDFSRFHISKDIPDF